MNATIVPIFSAVGCGARRYVIGSFLETVTAQRREKGAGPQLAHQQKNPVTKQEIYVFIRSKRHSPLSQFLASSPMGRSRRTIVFRQPHAIGEI